jgi:hypothetical protein
MRAQHFDLSHLSEKHTAFTLPHGDSLSNTQNSLYLRPRSTNLRSSMDRTHFHSPRLSIISSIPMYARVASWSLTTSIYPRSINCTSSCETRRCGSTPVMCERQPFFAVRPIRFSIRSATTGTASGSIAVGLDHPKPSILCLDPDGISLNSAPRAPPWRHPLPRTMRRLPCSGNE